MTAAAMTPQQYSMERVLFNVHFKVCMFALRRTSSRARSLAEQTLLVLAVCGFGVLLLSHMSFVFRTTNQHQQQRHDYGDCSNSNSSHYYDSFSSFKPPINSRPSTSTPSATTSWRARSTPLTCLNQIPGFTNHADITHLMLIEQNYENEGSNSTFSSMPSSSWAWTVWPNKHPPVQDGKNQKEAEEEKVCTEQQMSHTKNVLDTTTTEHEAYYIYFSYSRVKGYLLLPSNSIPLEQHNISVQHVFVSKTDVHCFGEPFLQHFILHLLGPDTVMINWLLALDEDVHNKESSGSGSGHAGYVYNPRTDQLIDLHPSSSSSSITSIYYAESPTTSASGNGGRSRSNSSSNNSRFRRLFGSFWGVIMETLDKKLALVLKTSFLFFITTTLVSFTLRETQERMVDFTHQLHWNVRNRRPVFRLVMTHFIDNLVFVPIMVGMIFFLIEFYQGDKVLAFMVLSIVWICEVFCLVSLRTFQGIHFFPRVFFLLFSMFHFYLFSFPHGFSYTALACTVCFMVHSMLFFWHRYELPAVARGLVTIENPRIGFRRPSASLPPPHAHDGPSPAPPTTIIGPQLLSTPPAPPRPVHPLTQFHQQQQLQRHQPPPFGNSSVERPQQQQQQQQPAPGRALARRNSLPAAWTTDTASSTTNHGIADGGSVVRANNENDNGGMSTPPTPFLYPVLRRTFSQTSSTANMSAVSGGRISRQPSMTGLFRSGADDDADDHNGDFIFFMGGEVVMHRGHGQVAAPSAAAQAAYSVAQLQQQQQQQYYYRDTSPPQRQQQQQQPPTVGMFIDNSSHSGSTQNGGPQQPQQRSVSAAGIGVPNHLLASVGVGPPTSQDIDDQGNTNGSLLDPSNNGHDRIEQQQQRQHQHVSPSVICSTASSSSPPPSPPSVVVLVNQSGGDDDDSSTDSNNDDNNNSDDMIDPPETSALQAILNISTPRRDNHGLSIRHRRRQENAEQDCRDRGGRSPPGFPALDDDDTNNAVNDRRYNNDHINNH